MRTKRVWENFCKVSYDNHKKQPTEKMFLEYLQLKKETGSSPAFVADSYRCLCRVFLYLFGQEFESILVEEYVMKESENIVKRTYPCPHCGEVCFNSFHILLLKGQLISKCLLGVFNFLQKRNKNKSYTSTVEFVRSFFGGNVGLKNHFGFV